SPLRDVYKRQGLDQTPKTATCKNCSLHSSYLLAFFLLYHKKKAKPENQLDSFWEQGKDC
ncbi:hypothetical protein, partial [Streptococcus sobrinus]|uniref:hypothetical protein n=1 Tax=Streptococcus sobrinus TaxID=1310 RepID=UPI001C3FC7F9